MGVRRVAKGVGDLLIETVGEAVAEVILNLVACALLGCLALIAYLCWSFSPRWTIAGAGLFSSSSPTVPGIPSAIPRRVAAGASPP
ncbi:hypothetical protein [Streptomyces mexicanus]|uniref:hypothetical protein n=1 Tax=Streptomyces mexicanus TaxID=178566 RepID=UPI003654B1FF